MAFKFASILIFPDLPQNKLHIAVSFKHLNLLHNLPNVTKVKLLVLHQNFYGIFLY